MNLAVLSIRYPAVLRDRHRPLPLRRLAGLPEHAAFRGSGVHDPHRQGVYALPRRKSRRGHERGHRTDRNGAAAACRSEDDRFGVDPGPFRAERRGALRIFSNRSDLQVVWTKIRNAVSDAQSDLPPGAGTSVVNDDFGDVFGIYYMLTGEGFTPAEMSDIAKNLRRQLLLVSGVAKVRVIGEQEEVIYVEVARQRASALGVSLDDIYNTLSQQNTVASAARSASATHASRSARRARSTRSLPLRGCSSATIPAVPSPGWATSPISYGPIATRRHN